MTTHSWLSSLSPFGSPYRMLQKPEAREASVEPVRTGAELVTTSGESLPLTGASLSVVAKGGIARAVLTQTFENDHDEPLHVTYKMPLPADGAVSGYAFEIGDRTVTGDVRPKAQARADFEAALAQGKTAGILEQEKADIFTQEIGNVPKRTRVVARITVDMRLAWLPEGEWELRFPTVIGPRYVGASDTAETVRAVQVAVAEDGVSARLRLSVVVKDQLSDGARVGSPTHAITTNADGVAELTAREGTRLDRDLVVRWRVAKPEVGLSLSVAKKGDRAFGLLTVVPPVGSQKAIARDLTILLDTSGSMGGLPLTHAKKILRGLVDSLSVEDRMELIEFSDSPRAYRKEPVLATEDEKRRAIAWIEKREAGGATEMRTAVLSALKALRPDAQRQVVLVTDGYIGGEDEILRVLSDALPKGCRMHMVGVGAAPNRSLATAIARAGRGVEILTADGEDLERVAKRIVDRTRAPMLTEVTVKGDAVTKRAPESVPDVYAGAPLLVALELAPSGGPITVQGTTAAGPWERTVRAPRIEGMPDEGAVPALFARERVADLDVRWASGRETAEIDRQVEELGVELQIATRLTSFVAIDQDRSVDPNEPYRKVNVPQELPYGTTFQGFGLVAPAGGAMATGAPAPMAILPPMSTPMPPMQSMPMGRGGFGAPPAPAGPASPASPAKKQAEVADVAPMRSAGMVSPSLGSAQSPVKSSRRPLFRFIALLLALGLFALAVYLLITYLR